MAKKKSTNKEIVIAAIGAVAAMQIVAFLNGCDGTIFAMTIGVIGALAGLALPTPKILQK